MLLVPETETPVLLAYLLYMLMRSAVLTEFKTCSASESHHKDVKLSGSSGNTTKREILQALI